MFGPFMMLIRKFRGEVWKLFRKSFVIAEFVYCERALVRGCSPVGSTPGVWEDRLGSLARAHPAHSARMVSILFLQRKLASRRTRLMAFDKISARVTRALRHGEGGASSSSDMGSTPGIVPGEASSTPVLLAGCIVACTSKVIFLSPRITVIGTASPAVM
jgi:hypothetical protein